MKIPPQEEDDFQNAEEELELDQSSELYKTIVAAIINEEDDGDIEDDGFDKLEESAPARDTKGKTATVIKRLWKFFNEFSSKSQQSLSTGQVEQRLEGLVSSEQGWRVKSRKLTPGGKIFVKTMQFWSGLYQSLLFIQRGQIYY